MRRMPTTNQLELINNLSKGLINNTVTVYDGDENPQYPISINFSQELCNDNEAPSLYVNVGDFDNEVGQIDIVSGFAINLSTPYASIFLDDEGITLDGVIHGDFSTDTVEGEGVSISSSGSQNEINIGSEGQIAINANGVISIEGSSGLNLKGFGIVLDMTEVPSTSSDSGAKGQIAFDNDYFYICTATNTWKRIALATW